MAMVHCNNCTSDLNAWVNIFKEFQESMGQKVDMNELYGTLYRKALEGDADCGGLLAYGYFSGEHVTGFEEGRPLFVRTPNPPSPAVFMTDTGTLTAAATTFCPTPSVLNSPPCPRSSSSVTFSCLNKILRMEPDAADVAGFEIFIERYKKGLSIERAAVDNL